jgi:hypothetical protein
VVDVVAVISTAGRNLLSTRLVFAALKKISPIVEMTKLAK